MAFSELGQGGDCCISGQVDMMMFVEKKKKVDNIIVSSLIWGGKQGIVFCLDPWEKPRMALGF